MKVFFNQTKIDTSKDYFLDFVIQKIIEQIKLLIPKDVEFIIINSNYFEYSQINTNDIYIHFGQNLKKISSNKKLLLLYHIPTIIPSFFLTKKRIKYYILKKNIINNNYRITLHQAINFQIKQLFPSLHTPVFLFHSLESKCKAVTISQREATKLKYAQGLDYFITNTIYSIEIFISILSSFSKFKKWQSTNMKIIVFVDNSIYPKAISNLENYKLRKDVVLYSTDDLKLFFEILYVAYCFIYVEHPLSYQILLDQAYQNNIPVLKTKVDDFKSTNQSPFFKEILMMYQDENYRKSIIKKQIHNIIDFQNEQVNFWSVIFSGD